MGLDTLTRRMVKVAFRLAKSLLVDIEHQAWTGDYNTSAEPQLALPVVRKAFVEWNVRKVVDFQGDEVISPCRLTFVQPLTVSAHDKLKAPPAEEFHRIAALDGPIDPLTKRAYVTIVDLA